MAHPRFNIRQFVFLLVLMQVALGVRLAAAKWWEDRQMAAGQKFGFGDSEGYWELGRTIARGEPYQYGEYRVFRTPGYPALLAPLFWWSGEDEPSVWQARAMGALLGASAVALVVLIAWRLFDERTAWIAGLIATFYPGQIATSIFVLSEAPFIPLMLLHLYAWQTAWRSGCLRGRIGYAIVGGFVCGLAVLVRPSWLLFVPFVAIVCLIFMKERWKQLQIVGVMLAALCVTMTPWWVRNYYITGKFVPTTLQVGISLADGLNPEADGGSDLERAKEALAEFDPVAARKSFQTFIQLYYTNPNYSQPTVEQLQNGSYRSPYDGRAEIAKDKHWRDVSTLWAWQNLSRVLQLAGIKFLRMWNVVPNASEFGGWKFRLLYACTYTPLLVCCLLGLWKFRARGFEVWLLFLPAIYFTLLHMIFVSSIRYQQPALMAWLILGAAFISQRIQPRSGDKK